MPSPGRTRAHTATGGTAAPSPATRSVHGRIRGANASVMETETGAKRTPKWRIPDQGIVESGKRRRTSPTRASIYAREVNSTRGTGYEGRDLQDTQERGVEAMEMAQGEPVLNEKDHGGVLDGGCDDTTGRTAMVRKRTGLHKVADRCSMDVSERLLTPSSGGVVPSLEPSFEVPQPAASPAVALNSRTAPKPRHPAAGSLDARLGTSTTAYRAPPLSKKPENFSGKMSSVRVCSCRGLNPDRKSFPTNFVPSTDTNGQ